MNCTQIQTYTNDYFDEQLSNDQQQKIIAHTNKCSTCKEVFRRESLFRQALGQLPHPGIECDFSNQLISRALNTATSQENKTLNNAPSGESIPVTSNSNSNNSTSWFNIKAAFATGFGSALAASLIIWFLFLNEPTQLNNVNNNTFAGSTLSNSASPSLNIAIHSSQELKLVFDSPKNLNNAKVSIYMPNIAELKGFPGNHLVSWHTNIKQGENLLLLPITAIQSGGGEIIAKVEHQGKIKTQRILLRVSNTRAVGA